MWWHSADQRGGGRGARRLESRIQQRSWPSLDRGTARTGGRVAGLQLASLSLRSGRGCLLAHGDIAAANRTEAVTRARQLGLIPWPAADPRQHCRACGQPGGTAVPRAGR